MNPTLSAALWITLIGMGLVFIALLLLWGLMALIVNATSKQAEAEAAGEEGEGEAEESQPEEAPAVPSGEAAKAAAAAVAVALSLQKKGHVVAQHTMLQRQPDGEPFSAWQPVLRANRLTQKSRMYSRKERGNGK